MAVFQKIYVEQFGGYWSFKPQEFVDLLKFGAKHGHFTLPYDKELKSKPSARKLEYAYHLLDWDKEDFEFELKTLKQLGQYPSVDFD